VLRAVIFDLDGTLVDHVSARNAALTAGLARLGLPDPPDRRELLDFWHALERRHMDEYLAGACSFDEQRRRRLAEFLPVAGGTVLAAEANAAWWREYSVDYERSWTAYDDVSACFATLLSLEPRPRLGVLTNGDGAQQRGKLAKAGVLDLLDGIFVSSEIGMAKPDRLSFHIACRGLGVEPNETLFVGDWLELDALAAIDAGLVGVWIDRPNSAHRPACLRITSLLEVPSLVVGDGTRQELAGRG
jgi:putative hydrolase of the HAD superfamily